MRTINIINLKGGVGKSITSINMAYSFAAYRNKKVLLIDNDKQGNISKFMRRQDYAKKSLSDILSETANIHEVIRDTAYSGIDIIPANMTLLKANRDLMLETTKPQQTRISNALDAVTADYDYCIIDNAPDINISVINALVAGDDVIIPVTIDEFAFEGIAEIMEQIKDVRKYYNPQLNFAGCLITSYRNDDVVNDGIEALQLKYGKVFDTKIRWTAKVSESTFARMPVKKYSPRCSAARAYIELVDEYERGLTNG